MRAVPALALLGVALAGCAGSPPQPVPPPPNVIVFLVDDLGWQDLSEPFAAARTAANDRFHTPNVERMCREGMKFPHAYAHPVCSPSRVSLLTGAAAARHRVTHWTLAPGKPTDPQRDGLQRPDWNTSGLSNDPATARAASFRTLPQRLAARGYATIHVGKAHFGAIGTPGADPGNLGFTVDVAGHAAGAPSSYHAQHGFLRRPGDEVWQVPGLARYHGQPRFLTDVLTDEALTAAQSAHERGQPFLLYLAHYAVHVPLDADARFVQRYRDAGLPESEACYAALVEGVDDSLGRVLHWLDDRGLTAQTLVVFTSDNGGLATGPRLGERNAPLRAGKGSAYEGGVRVPFVLRWPGQVPAGSVSPLPIQLEDLLPTLCEFVGADGSCPDGRSFAAVARGGEPATAAHPLFFHSPHYWGNQGPGIEPFSAVRDGDHKLIWFYRDGRSELYDVVRDPGETMELSRERPQELSRLRRLLHDHLAAVDAQVPTRSDGGAVERP